MRVRYGEGEIETGFDRSFFTRVIEPPLGERLNDPLKSFERVLQNPIGTVPYVELIKSKRPQKVAIIVEDKTRKNPEYPHFLERIIEGILSNSTSVIYLIAAYGTHSKHTREEHERLYGKENLERVILIDHDSKDKDNLVKMGTLTNGADLSVNRYAYEADFLITFGTISPHAFAGFTGGRKAILPGIASYEVIRANHCMVCLDNTELGVLDGNPIHENMKEAAAMLGVDFSIQIVRDNRGDAAGIFAGDIDLAFEKGVELCRKANSVRIDKPGDIVFVSCGGHPKDKSLYQSQRAITTAAKITRPGGLVVVFAEFSEGVGNKQYHEWLKKPLPELMNLGLKDIDIGVHSAYLTARNINRCSIALYTGMECQLCEELHFTKVEDADAIVKLVEKYCGKNCTAYLIPNGSEILIEV